MPKNPPTKPTKKSSSDMGEPITNGSVTISMIRKHSVRQYETLDVQISVTADVEPGESQHEATMRIYEQAREDMILVSNEMRDLAKDRDL